MNLARLFAVMISCLLAAGAVQAAPTFQAAGTQQNGTGNVTVPWPAHAVGDIALLFIESTGGQAANLSTPAGFAAVASSPQNTGTGTNGTRLTVYWARATSAAMASPVVTDPGDHVYARILTYRRVFGTGNPWDVTGGGVKAAVSGNVTVTGVTTTVPDTLIVQAVARDNDSTAAAFGAITNGNLIGIAERSDAGTTDGNGGGFGVWDGVKATAGATGNTTATVSNSINAFLTIALRPATTYYSRANANWATASTWSTAGCGGSDANQVPLAGSDVVICSGNTVTVNTSTADLGSLTIQNGGTLSIGNNTTARTVTVSGDVTNSGTLQVPAASNATHTLLVGGDFTNNGTVQFAPDANSLVNTTFNGSTAQAITGTSAATVFNNLTLNNAAGLTLTGTHNVTVNNTLTLTSGRITTNANILFIASGNAVSGADADDFVVGNLRKAYATGNQTRVFEVGTVAGGVRYAPVSVTLAQVTTAGNFTVSSTAGDHPNIGSSTLEGTLSINRYWTLTRDSVAFNAVAGNSIVFTYVNPGDYDAGADFSQFFVSRYVAPNWTEFTPSARTATTTTISGTGITQAGIAGAYQIAQRPVVATRLHVVLPGQTFVPGTGPTGAPLDRTAGVAFNLVSLVATDSSNIIATSYSGARTIAYSGPGLGGGVPPSYTTAVNFTNGVSTTALATTLTLAETTTLTATDGTLPGVQSAPFNVLAGAASRLHVVLPGQAFVQGGGAVGTASDQVIGVSFPLTSLVASDQFHNQATGYNSSPVVTWTPSPLAPGSTFTSPVSFSAGVSTTPLLTTIAVAGTYMLTADAAGLTGVPSGAFSVRESFACSGWLYHKLITIDSTRVGAGGVTDFPVLVRITDTDLRDKALPTGIDILFTDLTSTIKYDYEIERYNSATGELIAWVKLPSVSSSANTQFYMYYGNAAAGPQPSPAGVWSNGYRMVHHLEETGGLGTTLVDSTSNANNGAVAGTGATFPAFIDATGFIDGARSHPGVTAATPPALNFPNSGTLAITGAQTAEAWAYIESGQPTPDHNPVLWKGTTIGWGTAYQFRIAVGPNAASMTWGVTCGGTEGYFEAGVPLFNQWAHYAITWDGTTARAYINGVLQTPSVNPGGATACGGQALNTNAEPVRSGYALRGEVAGQQTFLRGRTDELRVSAAARSAGWLLTQYNNQSSPATFHTVGPELGQACLNHIRIEHDGIGLTCAPESVTVRACSDAACTSTYLGSVTTTLSPAGWVGGNTIVFTGGFAFAELRRTTPGFVTLGAAGTFPTTTATTRCFNGGVETCSMEFKTSGFIFNVPDLTSCKPSGNVTITAVRADETSQACVPAFESGTRSVNFWSVYEDPATGGSQVQVNGTPVATASPGTGINLAFGAGATSTFTVRYPDAGQVRLRAQYTGAGSESGLVMSGEDLFVAAPVGLAVVPSGGACVAGDATCAAYRKAGESFTHQVRAACWTSDADTDLSDNPVTPNFRMTGIPLSAGLVAPSGGANATLGATTVNFGSGDNGNAAVSQTVSEVGVFTISATPAAGAYFGLTVPGGTSPNIGRFTPDHFFLNGTASLATRVGAACTPASTFTYMDEAFSVAFSLQARNAAGTVTQNYTAGNGFAKLDPSAIGQLGFGARNDPVVLTGRLDLGGGASSAGFLNGAAAITATLGLQRGTSPEAPITALQLGIAPVDSDGVAITGPDLDADATAGNERKNLGVSAHLRFGRLRLQNAYGSGTIALPMPIETQYWNGAAFVRNDLDSCTRLAAADIGLSGYTVNLNAGETVIAQTTIDFNAGLGALTMTPPGAGNAGSVLLTPNLAAAGLRYLQGAWSGPTWDQNPAARAAFGVYGQPRNFIFYRENY